MEIVSDISKIKKGCVLTIGNFDGVHVGHQQILKVARNIATQKSTELVVMTFQPHPVAVFYPQKAPGVLTPLELKKKLLSQFNVDRLIVITDRPDFLKLGPSEFLEEFIVKSIRPATVIEGDDFNFGAKRAGNIKTLKQFGTNKGIEVVVLEAKQATLSTSQTLKVSSTMIRYMLTSGNVTDATDCLGRAYELIGRIIKGKGIGKKLGFPTLNLETPNQIIPAEAVYAGTVKVSDKLEEVCEPNSCNIPAVFSIGQARTFGDQHPLLIEAHLLIKNADKITGKFMAMDFVEYIRKQHKFTTHEELSAQIEKDCQKARSILT